MAAGTGTTDQYAALMGELWAGVNRTLGRVDALADEPDELASDRGVAALRRLQYRLHLAGEQAYGIAPPPGVMSAHAELRCALASARDATALIADTIEDDGPEGALPLLHEWRGALFRVRLARLRLAAPQTQEDGPEPRPRRELAAPLAAFVLALVGAGAFVAGATLGLWPLWLLGLAAVAATVVAYRP
ncbi:MAG TPA: hypothetical protein VFB26_07520 [Gaiellaceae bacterium]|nr:hypothetical protein [Gaiellaceae bacterium]